MYRLLLTILTIICVITEGHLMSIPVFGTKRYHRTPSLSGSVESSNLPYYNQLSTYYDNQPMSSSLSTYDTVPITSNTNSINNNNNNYQNGYLTENGYYYYPHHEYRSYGMPTYHGDYKPKPYYYAPAPHYSYYDDRDIISNPMDDLHEEILHEDERERQRELQPTLYGQESWYQTHNNREQQDELTNNFLKNLIEYNRQIDAQQKLQQQQQDELMQRDQEHKLQLQYQQQLQQQQQHQQQQELMQQQQPYGDDYDEYVELGDYEYEPQASENIYDMKKFERLDNIQPNYQQQQQLRDVYNPQQQQTKTISKHLDNDDEDVRQLKSLAHHANIQNIKTLDTKSSKPQHKTYKLKDDNDSAEEIDSNDFNNYSQNNWNQITKDQVTKDHIPKDQLTPRKSFAQYDNEPEEYDDGAWISWDRKRSPPDTFKNLDKWKQSLKKIESIKAFNNRKPLIVKVKDFKEKPSTALKTQIETTTKLSKATETSTMKNDLKITTILPKLNNNLMGQKEIVLPRPATNSQSNIFKGFGMLGNKNIQSKQQQQYDPLNLMKPDDGNDKVNNLNKDDAKRNGKKDNVYDTIKQLLAMEQQIEKTPTASKVQKRFVTNEENLVNELNNLKRTTS